MLGKTKHNRNRAGKRKTKRVNKQRNSNKHRNLYKHKGGDSEIEERIKHLEESLSKLGSIYNTHTHINNGNKPSQTYTNEKNPQYESFIEKLKQEMYIQLKELGYFDNYSESKLVKLRELIDKEVYAAEGDELQKQREAFNKSILPPPLLNCTEDNISKECYEFLKTKYKKRIELFKRTVHQPIPYKKLPLFKTYFGSKSESGRTYAAYDNLYGSGSQHGFPIPNMPITQLTDRHIRTLGDGQLGTGRIDEAFPGVFLDKFNSVIDVEIEINRDWRLIDYVFYNDNGIIVASMFDTSAFSVNIIVAEWNTSGFSYKNNPFGRNIFGRKINEGTDEFNEYEIEWIKISSQQKRIRQSVYKKILEKYLYKYMHMKDEKDRDLTTLSSAYNAIFRNIPGSITENQAKTEIYEILKYQIKPKPNPEESKQTTKSSSV